MDGEPLWKRAEPFGRPRKFDSPQDMWEKACAYFQWVQDNPLMEAKLVTANQQPCVESLPKMRPMTLEGLRLHMGIGVQTWYDYCQKDDFSEVTKIILDTIKNQKFEGAASGFFNPNIIARDLGLKEATSNEHSGIDGAPIQHDLMMTVEFVGESTAT